MTPPWLLAVAHFFGTRNGDGNSSGYLFWSGVGSDIAELAIFGWLYAFLRKHNCEVRGCWRIGRHQTAAAHSVCRRHHPDGPLTHHQVQVAHAEAARKTRSRL